MKALATHRFCSLPALLALTALAALPAGPAEAQVDPLWDHYKVYFAPPTAIPVSPVLLNDQFQSQTHQVQSLDLWMNPTEKTHLPVPPGPTYGINDQVLHYTWWRISPSPNNKLVTATNQFGNWQFNVKEATHLLNPALKNAPGGTPPPFKNHYKAYVCEGPPVNKLIHMADQFGGWTATVTYPKYWLNPVQKVLLPQPGGPIYQIVTARQHYVCYEFTQPDPGQYTATVLDQFINNYPVQVGPSPYICVPTDKTLVTGVGQNTWGKLKQLYR